MNITNHEMQLDLRLARSKEFGFLLKLIFYNSFEVITGFPRLFNQRTRFNTQFHEIVSLVEKTFQTPNKQGRAERKFTSCKNVIWGDVCRTPARAPASHSASPDHNFSHRWVTKFSYPWGSARLRRRAPLKNAC